MEVSFLLIRVKLRVVEGLIKANPSSTLEDEKLAIDVLIPARGNINGVFKVCFHPCQGERLRISPSIQHREVQLSSAIYTLPNSEQKRETVCLPRFE